MKSAFLEHRKAFLTPLSPLHLGSGQDFEPTNFVVDEKAERLYGFDPIRVPLTPAERKELAGAARAAGAFSAIQRFYAKHLDKYRNASSAVVPIDRSAIGNVKKLLDGSRVNDNRIPCTSSVLIGGSRLPYVPGSSLKGVIRTAVFDEEANEHPSPEIRDLKNVMKMDEHFFGGSMGKSPFSHLKVGDLLPRDESVCSRIIKTIRIHKNDEPLPGMKGIPAYIEAVEKGQYRAFAGEISKTEDRTRGADPLGSVRTLLKQMNRYYRCCFDKEAAIWERGNAETRRWLSETELLLRKMKPAFESGEAALIRIGHNSGAEALTIREYANIRIRKPRGQGYFAKETTTFFAAFEEAAGTGCEVLPFGWCILEADPAGDSQALKDWSAKVHEQSKFARFDQKAEKEKLRLAYGDGVRKAEEALKEQQEREEAEKRAAEEKARRIAANKEKYADLPENHRLIMELCDEIVEDPQGLESPVLKKRKDALMEAFKKAKAFNDMVKLAKELAKASSKRAQRSAGK